VAAAGIAAAALEQRRLGVGGGGSEGRAAYIGLGFWTETSSWACEVSLLCFLGCINGLW
jgi:hypothetical protein